MRSLPVRCLSFHFVAAFMVCILVTQPILAERPADGEARPPIHVRGNATTGPRGYTPTQVRHAYGLDMIFYGLGKIQNLGAGQTIAIVDAYDDPNIASD